MHFFVLTVFLGRKLRPCFYGVDAPVCMWDYLRKDDMFMSHHIAIKAIVDSRLRPQWCFDLANVTKMEEMLDCKLDALIRSFAWVKKRFS